MHITLFTITVHDYDEAVAFYTGVLGFDLLEDTDLGHGKRWVRVRPPLKSRCSPGVNLPMDSAAPAILLARGTNAEQLASVGNQTGGRVFMFLETDDLARDYAAMTARGVTFIRPPAEHSYGIVAVFVDLFGNKFDLIQPRMIEQHTMEIHGRDARTTRS